MRDAADLLSKTTEAKDLDELMGRYHFPIEGRPLGMLLRTANAGRGGPARLHSDGHRGRPLPGSARQSLAANLPP